MNIDLEADLRREFDAATPPSSLTVNPESILRQGTRTIRRRRIMAAGSAAMAVAVVATGASVLSRPHTTAAPQPATRTATTTATTGILRAPLDSFSVRAHVEFNRDPRVRPNVKFVVDTNGKHQVVGVASTARPGEKPEAIWRSGVVDGHPFTFGLVPGTDIDVRLAAGTSTVVLNATYGEPSHELKGSGYSPFSLGYTSAPYKPPPRLAQIASVSWSGPTGIVDGIEGDHRLSGKVLELDSSVSVRVVLGSGKDGRTTVSGDARFRDARGGYTRALDSATSDASGAAVMSGRYPTDRVITVKDVSGTSVRSDGPPIAAGFLPPGASSINVLLTKGVAISPVVVSERLPDGRVAFALKAQSAHPSTPSADSIKAVTWTNLDGSKGRQNVTQQKP